GLFSEQITLRLFFESGLQNSGAGRANSVGVAKRVFPGAATGILVDGKQGRNAAALRINTAQQMTGTLGRDHDHVHIFRRNDSLEVNTEAMRNAKYLSWAEDRKSTRLNSSHVAISYAVF